MNDYIDLVIKLFQRQFAEAYLESPNRKRKSIFPFISTIYRRWYYSALIEATPLTPANIIASISAAHGSAAEIYPSVVLRSKSRWNGIMYNTAEYSVENHPVTEDLRIVVKYCTPSIDLFDEDCFADGQAIELSEALSINDPYYASFLLEIAFRMRLITKIPSIYANRTQVAKDVKKRLAVSNEALFDEIVEASIKIAVFNLSMMPLPEPMSAEAFIRGLLKEPMATGDIFEYVYDAFGFSMDDLLDEGLAEEFEDFDASILSGTFFIGVLLDKFFFTPFGYFLKLIRPIYVLPFDFQKEFKYFFEPHQDSDEIDAVCYAPCSNYHFTKLGLKYFNIKATPDNYADAALFLPFEELKASLLTQDGLMDRLPIMVHEELPDDFPFIPVSGRALSFKIKLANEQMYWINLDISEESTLHRFYTEITRYFFFERNGDYSFFHGETENPFTEYAPPFRTRKAKNTSEAPLSEFDFGYSKKFLLLVHNQSGETKRQTYRLIIEYLGEKPKDPRGIYPSVTKMSKAIRTLHEETD